MQTATINMPHDLKITDLVAMANAINCELVSKGGKIQMIPRAQRQCAPAAQQNAANTIAG